MTVRIEGSELVVADGSRLVPRMALVGAILNLDLPDGSNSDVRIDAITVDPQIPWGDVILYDLSIAEAPGHWEPVCAPEADGTPHAILRPTPDGRIAVFCTAGALGKCIRFGYRPWANQMGRSLEPYWQACVRMVRADYCGNDVGTTRDGMLIDIWDNIGIQERTGPTDFSFEAAWGPEGAVCVAHPRVPQHVSLVGLAEACPRLLGRIGSACTEEAARKLGEPLIYNASRGDGIPEAERR